MSLPRKRTTLSVAISVALTFVIAVPANAGAENKQIAETDRLSTDAAALYQRVSQISAAPGTDVLFVDNEETLIFDGDGRVVRTRYYLYKVLTQRGAEGWGNISSTWDPWHVEKPALRARVITPDNQVHNLDERTFTDAPQKENKDNVFSDRRVMRAPLPAVAPGSLIEEEEISRESAPFFGAGSVERFYFGSAVAVQHTRLVLDAPAALPLHYDIELLPDLKPQKTEADGRVRIAFDYGLIDVFSKPEVELPSDVPAFPNVAFSTGVSWGQVADGYGKIVDKQIAGADLRTMVAKLTVGKDLAGKIAAIMQYLNRQVRYTGVEFGESVLVPHSPAETLARKYGDCKDKSTLLVAMLRAANIPAYVVLLNAGSREDVSPKLAGLGLFDHAIVYVPRPPDRWIDATDEYARLGEIPNSDQGRLALIVRPESTELTRTPVLSSTDNALVEKREVFLAENGPARIIETSEPHGSGESFYRRSYADKQNKAAQEQLTNYIKSQYLADKLDRMDRSDPDDTSQQFKLVLESDRAKRGATELNMAVAAIRFEGLFSRLPYDLQHREQETDSKADSDSKQKATNKRSADFQLPEAFVTEWQYTIVPPAGFKPKPLPANVNLSLGPAMLTEKFSSDDNGQVHATLRFDTVKRRLTVPEATELRDKIAQLVEQQPLLIYFEPIGQTLINQGKVSEAFQAYRDLITLHPKESVHHLQLAEVLLAAGLGEAARAEAKIAVKLEPTSALAEKTLAGILEYDVVGRRFRPGSDYTGAEAAYRAAEKLDPDDKATVVNLAVLLEFNRWGLRYGPGSKLKEAIAEYRKLTPESRSELAKDNLAFALFYNGEFTDAQTQALSLNPQPTALIIACEAALRGSQNAFAKARKRTPTEEQFKQIVKVSGDMLVNLRMYSPAADLVEAGASGDNAAETAADASLYRKMRRHEQIVFPDDPTGAALRFEMLMDNPDLTLEELRSASSRNGKIGLATQEVLDTIKERERRDISRNARDGEFEDVGIDRSLVRAEPRCRGNDESGYEVLLWPSRSKTSVFVVKEAGQYKVLGTGEFDAAIGLEVLDRIAANNLTGARALLDWLRERWHLIGGDDPLSSAPFPLIWTQGKEADAGTMKLAVAALFSQHKQTALQGVKILEEARESVRDGQQKVNISLGLIYSYAVLEMYDKALPVVEDLAKEYLDSAWAFTYLEFVLRDLGRSDEGDRLAEERLKRIPDDDSAMSALVSNAFARGDYTKMRAAGQAFLKEGKTSGAVLNTIAWDALFSGSVGRPDVETALKAVELSKDNASVLHTLGCVYAETGKTKEAREVLVHAMDLLNLDDPNDNYLYAFGRIAEEYGEREAAIASYTRIKRPTSDFLVIDSTYRLAQIRLQALHRGGRPT